MATMRLSSGIEPLSRYLPEVSQAAKQSQRASEVTRELNQRFEEAYDENGVDRSLIRWSLARTPTERVLAVEESLNALATLRRLKPSRYSV